MDLVVKCMALSLLVEYVEEFANEVAHREPFNDGANVCRSCTGSGECPELEKTKPTCFVMVALCVFCVTGHIHVHTTFGVSE